MANRYAVANGDWSNTATWDGGTLPTSADDVYTNNFNVNVNQNIDVISLRNTAGTGITAGGTFTFNTPDVTADISDNLYIPSTTSSYLTLINITSTTGTITLNVFNGTILNTSGGSGGTTIYHGGNCNFTVNANKLKDIRVNGLNTIIIDKVSLGILTVNAIIEGATNPSGNNFTGPGTLRLTSNSNTFINGNIIGSNGGVWYSNIIITNGNLTITGTITGVSSYAINSTTSGTITVIGDVLGPSFAFDTIFLNSASTFIVTGNIIGGTAGRSIFSSFNSSIIISGNITGGPGGVGISISNGNLSVTGTIQGGTSNGAVGASITGGTLNHIGVAQASAFGSAIACNTPTTSVVTCTGPFLRNGFIPAIASQTLRINALSNPYFEFRKSDNTDVTYVDEDTLNFPIELDVREGTSYASGLYTGTLAVPLPSNVRVGIATDDTVGTADLTAEDFWNYLVSNGFASGSMGERMKNVSTVASTGAQIASYSV
jgi:hypothetical protein